MISILKKHIFGISLAFVSIAIAVSIFYSYGKAILDDYKETQIAHEIENIQKQNQQEETDAERPEQLLIKGKNLFNLQQKYKDFKFKLSGNQILYDGCREQIHEILISYYKQCYAGSDFGLYSADDFKNDKESIANANIKIDKEIKNNNKKELDKLFNSIIDDESIKNIDRRINKEVNIALIDKRKEELALLLPQTPAANSSAEKVEADASKESPQTSKADSNDWQKAFILTPKKDENGKPVLDSNGNPVYVLDDLFEDIKNSLDNISELYVMYNKLMDRNIDHDFIDELGKCDNFADALKCITKTNNEATTIKAAEALKDIISNENAASVLKSLDNIQSLDEQYVKVICDHIKQSLDEESMDVVLGCLKYKLLDKFVNIVCNDLKNKIEISYINSSSFNNESFAKLNKTCATIISNKDNIQNQPLYTFACNYNEWHDKLSKMKSVSFVIKDAAAETEFEAGIVIYNFTGIDGISYKSSDTITKKQSFLKNIQNLKAVNLPFNQPLKIDVTYYLLDATGWSVWSRHTTDTKNCVIYPELRSEWVFKHEIKKGDSDPIVSQFSFEIKKIKNDNKQEMLEDKTLEDLFNNAFHVKKKAVKK